MTITQRFITPNEWSRPQIRIKELLGIVIHWTANPQANAEQNRAFFESRKNGLNGYGSAHYIIGQDGETLQCIPDYEIAYHVGSSKEDPASGRIYTDYAREKFRKYAINYKTSSPNYCTLGIELCPTNWYGHFTDKTINSAIELCAKLCTWYVLKPSDITTHYEIVGWKACPRLWTEKPELLTAFKKSVADYMSKRCA